MTISRWQCYDVASSLYRRISEKMNIIRKEGVCDGEGGGCKCTIEYLMKPKWSARSFLTRFSGYNQATALNCEVRRFTSKVWQTRGKPFIGVHLRSSPVLSPEFECCHSLLPFRVSERFLRALTWARRAQSLRTCEWFSRRLNVLITHEVPYDWTKKGKLSAFFCEL
jgi:hypothetical protein